MLTAITWTLALLSLAGTVLNIQKRPEGFYFWIAANAGWVFINWAVGVYALAFLFGIYLLLAVYGAWAWTRGGRERFGHINL